jgi:signal transduction histidine kinase
VSLLPGTRWKQIVARLFEKEARVANPAMRKLWQVFGRARYGAAGRLLFPEWRFFVCAVVLAVLLSTEFLFQPFVWRNYELSEILSAWLMVARDRVIVALPLATALAIQARVRVAGPGRRAVLLAVAILVGAGLGEWLLALVDTDDRQQDMAALIGNIVRWSLVGMAVATTIYLWRAAAELSAATGEAAADAARLRRLAAASRIEALQRQIEPHFLFNTLATIRSLHGTDPDRGQQLLGRLLQLMSATLGCRQREGSPGGGTTLGGEIELVLAYLDVCAARMQGQLIVRRDVSERLLDLDFPALALSTLAENAMKHGMASRDNGTILISAEQQGDALVVAVSDDGAGFTGKAGGSGIGLANIAERLRLLYGLSAGVRLQSNPGGGVRASLHIPLAAAGA